MPTNDNESMMNGRILPSFDAHGRAALLLVESLIHGLCANATLSAGEAMEIAERAMDVQDDQAETAGEAGAPMWQSHALLSAIMVSLSADDQEPPRPGATL